MDIDSVVRVPEVCKTRGRQLSTLYRDIAGGLFPAGFSIGGRHAVGWFKSEVEAINRAWAAGATQDQVRVLVQQLIDRRKSLAPPLPPATDEPPKRPRGRPRKTEIAEPAK